MCHTSLWVNIYVRSVHGLERNNFSDAGMEKKSVSLMGYYYYSAGILLL
jgi:hypothetical protein